MLYAGFGLALAGACAVAFWATSNVYLWLTPLWCPAIRCFLLVSSLRLTARLENALKLYRDGICPVIIVSGGIGGKEGVDEAKAMASWLFQRGVPRRAVVIDSSGVNTASKYAGSAI